VELSRYLTRRTSPQQIDERIEINCAHLYPTDKLDAWEPRNMPTCRCQSDAGAPESLARRQWLSIAIHDRLVIGRKGHASFRSLGLLGS